MKLTTISTTYERKINLGNYQSAHIGITLWADLAEEDDLDECAKALWTMATENVRYKASQIKNGKDPDPEPVYLGLPIRFDDPAPLNGQMTVETTEDS